MKKLKIFLLLLLTAALLLGCAVLPKAAAWLQDKAAGTVHYADLQPVYLELGSEAPETEPAFNILEKLSIIQQSYMFPLTSGSMRMTEEEVMAAAMEQLQPYFDSGFISESDFPYYMPAATIAMSADQLGTYVKFWTVNLVNENDPYRSVFLHLDDETGKILLIQYETTTENFYKENQQWVLEEVAAFFFQGLGLDTELETLEGAQANVETIDLTGKATALRCSIDTAQYGQILIEIYVNEQGFFTCFPYEF